MPPLLNPDTSWPLLLSVLAGLSTSIGGALAIIVKPSHASMASLLGVAIGVMATLSVVELLIDNALHQDPFLVCAACALGAVLYWAVEPFFPKVEEQGLLKTLQSKKEDQEQGVSVQRLLAREEGTGQRAGEETAAQTEHRLNTANLLRLGMLMAITMTLHNLPEGFAVAFSAYTDFGPVMALAIAVHNIPEGIIIAAPIYAATGSRWRAMVYATASGLSEPLGALLALLLLRPYFTVERLQYLLAFVGGIMLAVCAIELYPEGRACHNDWHFIYGIIVGAAVMGCTLYLH